MRIKEYSEDIQKKLEEFIKISYNSRGIEYQPNGRHSDTRKIKQVYYKNGGFFWIVEDENKIVGSIALKMLNPDLIIGEIKRFFVLPSNQGNGLGTVLMKKLIDEAQKSEVTTLRLDTMRDSTKALKIFRKFGFKEIEKYNDNEIAEIFMELQIL